MNNQIIPWNKRNDIREKSKEIINLYKNKSMNVIEISKIFKCGIKVIINILKENNTMMTCSKRRNKLLKEGRIKAWNKGLTKEIDGRVRKYSNSLKGHMRTEGHRRNLSLANKGKKRSKKTREKMSASKIGKKRSEESIKKQKKTAKLNPNYGMKNKRHSKETKIKMCEERRLEKHPNWLGGKSFEPYGVGFNKKLKEQIRKRDDFTCQECGKNQKELKKSLFIHHIDYNKQNNSKFNLISLCNSCHTKTNSNRKHWANHLKMKIFLMEFFNPQNIKVFKNKKLIAMEII